MLPDNTWAHFDLYQRVREALYGGPRFFTSDVRIAGVQAVDIFSANTLLGAAIEERLIETLNQMRPVWDPDEQYLMYSFVRQSQTFPDVLLRNVANATDILLGIELKGWYVLAKEGAPSYRFNVTPNVCGLPDLIAVFPWYLSEVISGVPRLLPPYIESAKYAAEYRNYNWQHLMEGRATSPNGVVLATATTPYPKKSDPISDAGQHDPSDNFGRFARAGVMNDYLVQVGEHKLSGIPTKFWREFLSAFKDSSTDATVTAALRKIKKAVASAGMATPDEVDILADKLLHISKYVG